MVDDEGEVSRPDRPITQPPQRGISPPPPFLEVKCKSSGKLRRFAAGTEAKFALYVINKKLEFGNPTAWYIEAVKEGEEPVIFGPRSVLVDYGDGWKLQTVTELEGLKSGSGVRPTTLGDPPVTDWDGSTPAKLVPQSSISLVYIGKILLAFLVIFLLAATFTLALENLPRLIMLISSSM